MIKQIRKYQYPSPKFENKFHTIEKPGAVVAEGVAVVPTAGPVRVKICKEKFIGDYYKLLMKNFKSIFLDKIYSINHTVKSYRIRQTLFPTGHTL